jgi:YwiC-like protein
MDTASKTEIPGASQRRSAKDGLSSTWRNVHPTRRWTLVWPREHGAWGMLLVSLITGASIGFSSATVLSPLLWLTVAVVAAFCLRTPIENSLPASPFRPRGSAEWRWMIEVASIYAVTGALAVAMLTGAGFFGLLWKLGLAAAGLFVLQAVVKRLGRGGRLPGEIIGVFGLTLAAAAGWAVAAGGFGRQALAIWILNGLFTADQILYVQLRIRGVRASNDASGSRDRSLLLAVEALIALLLIGGAHAGFIPWLVFVAFIPVFMRGGAWSLRRDHGRLRIHRLGKSELFHSILFGLLLITAFHLPIH